MPYGGNDWLSLTIEDIVEPNIEICDPHHHLWDKRLERIPHHRYLLEELLQDIDSGHNIRSTVFIEAEAMLRSSGPAELRSIGEVEFVQGTAAASASGIYGDHQIAAGIVGSANLNLGEQVKPILEALKIASPNRFRGIRHRLTSDPNPELASTSSMGTPHQMSQPTFREGAAALSEMGMTFEAWLYHHQLLELAEFARALPDLTIILNHIGGLLRIGPYQGKDKETIPAWKEGIEAVGECENVVVKLGGMGMPIMGFDWYLRDIPIGSDELAHDMEPFINYCIDKFGTTRSMFESNFPVDKVSFSYHVMYNAFKKLSVNYSDAERADMFCKNAKRVYALE